MLLSPIIYYILEYIFILILCYDCLGFIVAYNKSNEITSTKSTDYRRLVFSWVYIFSLKAMRSSCCCFPLVDELVLLGTIFFTLPVLHGTEKTTNYLFSDDGFKKTFSGLIDMILSRLLPQKKQENK